MNVRTASIYVIGKIAVVFLVNVYILDSIFKPYKQSK